MFLYLGDDDMTRAAGYLSGIMLHHDIPFERVDSTAEPADDFGSTWYDGYILSDYPRKQFRDGQLERIWDAVKQGAGLLMIGGWESFFGQSGEYHDSVLAEVLPVNMAERDDRRNFSQPVMVMKHHDHPILDDLPWDKPPFVGGLNQFSAKHDSVTLLKALCSAVRTISEDRVADCGMDSVCLIDGKPVEERFSVPLENGDTMFLSFTETLPLLVVGQYGKGRTAALATDVAPHWVGGWVDWGKRRVTQKLPDGGSVEIGDDYAQFFAQLVRWVAG